MSEEQAWFDRDKYKAVRTCQCFCGTVFQSQARGIVFVEKRTVLTADGGVKKDKHGQKIVRSTHVDGFLSLTSCPKCQINKIKAIR